MSRVYPAFYFLFFILLSFVALKLSIVRIGQLFLILLFAFIFLDDYHKKKIDYKILFFFFISAVVLILISLNSVYGKIGEYKFFIKYLLIFPLAFYVGAKSVQKLRLKELVEVLELSVFVFIVIAFLIKFDLFPFHSLIVYREGFGGSKYIEFQGTFAEAGIMAEVVYMMALISFLLRYEFKISCKYKYLCYAFYFLVFISLVLTKNKTIWISMLAVLMMLVVLKFLFYIFYANYFQPKYKSMQNRTLELFESINGAKLLLFALFIVIVLYSVNELLPEPIVTIKTIKLKLAQERGKAFLYVMDLLKESHWLGCYGFGFVEYYFTHLPVTIIGLGKGVGMIFNSYLDVWLSVGILGVLFHFLLLYFSFSKNYFLTIVVPVTIFIYNNFNPFLGDEFNYVFLGISYGIVQRYVKKEEAYLD